MSAQAAIHVQTFERKTADQIFSAVEDEVAQAIEIDLSLTEYGATRASCTGLNYVNWFDSAASKASSPNIMCGKGCSCCCYYMVAVQATEIFLIERYIRSQSDSEQIKWCAIIKQRTELSAGLNYSERQANHIPCAFLRDDQTCASYDVRPIACRAYESFDSNACRSGNLIPVNGLLHAFGRAFHRGAGKALRNCGFRGEWFELHAGLNVALETPDAEQRWLAGENIFSELPRL